MLVFAWLLNLLTTTARFCSLIDEINISRNRNNTTVKECSWLKCPGQFFHVTNIMKDFGKPSFIDGVIFAVPVTILGSLLIGTLICVILRYICLISSACISSSVFFLLTSNHRVSQKKVIQHPTNCHEHSHVQHYVYTSLIFTRQETVNIAFFYTPCTRECVTIHAQSYKYNLKLVQNCLSFGKALYQLRSNLCGSISGSGA